MESPAAAFDVAQNPNLASLEIRFNLFCLEEPILFSPRLVRSPGVLRPLTLKGEFSCRE